MSLANKRPCSKTVVLGGVWWWWWCRGVVNRIWRDKSENQPMLLSGSLTSQQCSWWPSSECDKHLCKESLNQQCHLQCWGIAFSHQHTNELHWMKPGPGLNLTPTEGINGQGGNKRQAKQNTNTHSQAKIGCKGDPARVNDDVMDVYTSHKGLAVYLIQRKHQKMNNNIKSTLIDHGKIFHNSDIREIPR